MIKNHNTTKRTEKSNNVSISKILKNNNFMI